MHGLPTLAYLNDAAVRRATAERPTQTPEHARSDVAESVHNTPTSHYHGNLGFESRVWRNACQTAAQTV